MEAFDYVQIKIIWDFVGNIQVLARKSKSGRVVRIGDLEKQRQIFTSTVVMILQKADGYKEMMYLLVK
jgi:hypothetical protein